MEGFTINNGIEYDGYCGTINFEIDWHATIEVSPANKIVHVAIGKNNVALDSSIMGTEVETTIMNFSGTDVTELSTGDRAVVDYSDFNTVIEVIPLDGNKRRLG
jgi:hypothetical protein